MKINNLDKYKASCFRVLKYGFSSGSSFAIDLLLFTIFNHILNNILVATIIARVISSFYNYLLNSRYVFKQYSKTSIIKYYILVIIQMFASGFLVSTLARIFSSINDTIIKVCVDMVIFIVNYFVQKLVVFK